MGVGPPETTVSAVAGAEVGKFDKCPYIDMIPENLPAHEIGLQT